MQEDVDVYFKINYKTELGWSVYICGNIDKFGNWKPINALRMQYNPVIFGGWWSIMIKLPRKQDYQIEYKFLINKTNPNNDDVKWEKGENRIIETYKLEQDVKEFFIEEIWSYRSIKIKLSYNMTCPNDFMYVIGSDAQLGAWQTPMKMKQTNKNIDGRFTQNWSYIIYVDPDTFYFRYYYVIKNEKENSMVWERGPGRVIKSGDLKKSNVIDTPTKSANHTLKKTKRRFYKTKIEFDYANQGFNFKYYKSFGRYYIIDTNFNSTFDYDLINLNIYVGPYPQNEDDILSLRNTGIRAVLNLQNQIDMDHRGIRWQDIQQLYKKHNIQLVNYEILDMNVEDFIKKGYGAAKQLKQLIDQYETVYVHCTCGIGRAPSTVVLYLILFENYDIDHAMQFVKDRRPSFFNNYCTSYIYIRNDQNCCSNNQILFMIILIKYKILLVINSLMLLLYIINIQYREDIF